MALTRVTPATRHGIRPAAGVVCSAAITVGLLATGCSTGLTGSAADVTPPAIAATPTAPATGYDGLIQLPLSAYGTSEQDDVLLYRTNEAPKKALAGRHRVNSPSTQAPAGASRRGSSIVARLLVNLVMTAGLSGTVMVVPSSATTAARAGGPLAVRGCVRAAQQVEQPPQRFAADASAGLGRRTC